MTLPKLNPNTPTLMDGEVRLFKRKHSSVVYPAAGFLPISIADDLHRSTIRSQFVGHDDLWIAVSLH